MGSLRPDGEEKDTHADPETCWRRLGHGCVKFNLPDGAEYAGPDEDGNDRFRVSIPLDEHGLFGRECPSCERTFLVSKESYDPLPDDLRLWCVYCGYNDDHSKFMSSQQQKAPGS